MRKITIDTDEWIKDAEEGKYKINTSAYARGCNDVLDYYIKKLKYTAKEQYEKEDKAMKVYEKNESVDFVYPDEMIEILDYLNKHGTILVKPSTIESLYFRFSDEQYSASWMIVDEDLLKEFEEWLTEVNI